MTEFWLFIIVGAIAVAAAVMMLLSENAVYSALFLIVTMACIAFLFLLLDAPFLAMIQITVYAGAIMVLFIFVIMLLGAERLGAAPTRYRWLTPVAVLLSIAFLLTAGLGIASGGVDQQSPVADLPLVRALNVAPDMGEVDVYANDLLVASDLDFNEASDYITLPVGEYTISFAPEEGEAYVGTFSFGPETAQTLLAYGGSDNVTLSVVPNDVSAPPAGSARITFFHAFPETGVVDLVDLGSDGEFDVDLAGVPTDRILIDDFEPGDVSTPLIVEGGVEHWAFVAPNGDIVRRVIDGSVGRSYTVEPDTTQLIVLSGERSAVDNTLRSLSAAVVDEARPVFGGPEAIGEDLFTRYLLPFELVSLLLLASMIGAIVLTHKEEARVRDRSAMRRRVSRPLASVIAAQVGHEVTQEKEPTPALPAETNPSAGD